MLTRLVNRMTGFLGRAFGRASAGPSEEVPPDTTEGTVEPLREGVREALVPRWLAVLRTQVFTLVAASALAVFAVLTALVEAGMTAGPDLAGSLAVQHLATPWVAALMGGVSALGFPPLSVYLVIGVVALFWLAGYRTEGAFAIVASASAILTQAIKTIVERPRPAPDLVRVIQDAPGYSFPSGHTLFYTTFFGFIGYAAFALLKPGHLRTVVLWVCGALIVLVGPSRIWLGHHWPSDVLASYALGLAYLIFLVQMYSRVRLRSRVPASPDRPVQADGENQAVGRVGRRDGHAQDRRR